MNTKQKLAIGSLLISGMLLAASPALAEGRWSSYLKEVGVGFSSRTWTDNATDQVATTIKLSGCSMNVSGTFSARINLYREYGFLPDQSVGIITNTCNTSNFGEGLPGDMYHFTIDRIKASTNPTYRVNATSVVTGY